MKLTTEQLIKIAQDKKEELKLVKPTAGNDVLKFINAWDIKEGKHRVYAPLLYQAYKAWSLRPHSRKSFLMRFSRAFEPNRGKDYSFYLLNYRPVELLNKIENLKIKV